MKLNTVEEIAEDARQGNIAILVTGWNSFIADNLLTGAPDRNRVEEAALTALEMISLVEKIEALNTRVNSE